MITNSVDSIISIREKVDAFKDDTSIFFLILYIG